LGSYQKYLWNDFSTGPSLTLSHPGKYWLQVTDSNNCVGTDTIQVNDANCRSVLLVPSGFTPNGDGLNDLLEPKLLGDVVRFKFSIYDRWGEEVFETQSLGKGWDGKLNGSFEATGVFTWFCEYQLAGQNSKVEKGIVTLIR
jgi:gliding motility-associated-like protein